MRSPRSAAVLGAHDECEAVTGHRPFGCAWWGFFDPDVADVIAAHAWYEEHQVRELWGDDPEAWLVEALGIYVRALERARADRQRRTAAVRAATASAPGDGWQVEGVTRG